MYSEVIFFVLFILWRYEFNCSDVAKFIENSLVEVLYVKYRDVGYKIYNCIEL